MQYSNMRSLHVGMDHEPVKRIYVSNWLSSAVGLSFVRQAYLEFPPCIREQLHLEN